MHMRRLLIADGSEDFASALQKVFCKEFDIRTCSDGNDVLAILDSFRPDAMILNLMLPHKDGLTLLREAPFLPKAVLALAPYRNPYIEHAALSLGVSYILICPCLNAIRVQLMDLLQTTYPPSAASSVAVHLHILNVSPRLDGYHYLCIGIPLFHKDPNQRLSKELYPTIAAMCDSKDARAVEHSIRNAIKNAWLSRDPYVWAKYFPADAQGNIPCPCNKAFIAKLAEMLDQPQ